MSTIHAYETHRNTKGNGMIILEKVSDLYIWGWSKPYWQVLFKRDNGFNAELVKTNLKNKPNKARIGKLKEDLC